MKCEEGRDEGERWWGKGAEGEDDKEKGAAMEARWVNRSGKIKKKKEKRKERRIRHEPAEAEKVEKRERCGDGVRGLARVTRGEWRPEKLK